MSGYIKDYRKELDSDIWMMPPLYHRIWQYLKYKVNHQQAKIPMRDGTFLNIQPGQHLTSVRDIAKAVGWYEGVKWKEPNPKTVSTILDWLVKQSMISIDRGKGNRQYTLITLIQWESYQAKQVEGNSKVTPREHLVDINKNDKECLNNDFTTTTTTNEPDGESDGTLYPDPSSGDHQLVGVDAEISHTPVDKLLDHYADLRKIRTGKDEFPTLEDIDAVKDILDKVPVDQAMKLLTSCFNDFDRRNSKYPGKRITSFRYCYPYILDHYKRSQARKEVKHGGHKQNHRTDSEPKRGSLRSLSL
ncbi:hypothetical protein GCM10011391_28360 [Pullulanibacillus camelliae]|uniref:DNA replication protein DnaD n=1 Tax=Pullulanibacillus camelliae TaxID=1707096 RepID=A0A8J2YJF7_9BACL|nr:hypothetical protein [Pullulanibacillus camelliae]GGE47908.1 hypothetical protein GCM10011391_28360 [Pullulanibacillus camelliae]